MLGLLLVIFQRAVPALQLPNRPLPPPPSPSGWMGKVNGEKTETLEASWDVKMTPKQQFELWLGSKFLEAWCHDFPWLQYAGIIHEMCNKEKYCTLWAALELGTLDMLLPRFYYSSTEEWPNHAT